MFYIQTSSIFTLVNMMVVTFSLQHENKNSRLECREGTSLANSICLPKGYNQGEIPTIPTVILTTFEINNIREINDKKMTVTFEFYQELTWIDDRILANLSQDVLKLGGMPLTSNQLKHIWTPGLWIQSLFSSASR